MTRVKPIVIIVAALLPDLGIGIRGKMPWRLKEEIKYFKEVTSRTEDPNKINAVVMGRKTWNSIPEKFRPLKDRLNVILSRNVENHIENDIIYANSFANGLKQIEKYPRAVEKIFVIGGSEVYNQLIKTDEVSHILLTEITNSNAVEMDTWLDFPIYQEGSQWKKQPGHKLKAFTGYGLDPEQELKQDDYCYKFTLWEKD
ncbi:uncharacterized protein PRCAT00004207001 [Priceomyces carsonii]|uniref:uncharacterized protein n=1 Tax=Priceomyces carsonii TaxID=28549 RepID=UPI002ED877B5|nr:unnamed protein product [Priceomyces carsonii]